MLTRSLLCGLAVSTGLGTLSGCASMLDAGRQSWHQTVQMFTPSTGDYRDPTELEDDPWSFAASDGRGMRPVEKGVDSLFSSKAQAIERSVGFD